jgi:hypothetical protein
MLTKNVPKDNLYWYFSRMILDGIAGINSFSVGKFSHFQQFLKHTILLRFFQRRTKKRGHSENNTITSKVSFITI